MVIIKMEDESSAVHPRDFSSRPFRFAKLTESSDAPHEFCCRDKYDAVCDCEYDCKPGIVATRVQRETCLFTISNRRWW